MFVCAGMAQRELSEPYQLHRTLLEGFNCKREDAAVLHRVERIETSRHTPPVLLVQSNRPPNTTIWQQKGQGQYLLSPPETKPVKLTIETGWTLSFRLRANPSKKVKREGHKQSQRRSFHKPDEQIAWLRRKGEQHGFQLVHVTISPSQKQVIHHKNITFYTVQFDGVLTVTNADQFNAAWQKGIGASKAFGCGLLSLGRA